jgi:hypothetical protein
MPLASKPPEETKQKSGSVVFVSPIKNEAYLSIIESFLKDGCPDPSPNNNADVD